MLQCMMQSLALHADGYDSQDSEAYIPLVKSALEQEHTSRDAACTSEGTSKQPHGISKVPDTAGDGAGVSVRDEMGRSGAGTSDSAAIAVNYGSVAAYSAHEGPVKERRGMPDSGDVLLPDDGSAKTPNMERGEPGARQGTSGRKRKVKHKSSKKHKSKRRKADDGEGCDEKDRAVRAETRVSGSAGKAAVCDVQSLEDLRSAALQWASKARGDCADAEDSVALQHGKAADET